jgi:hypothetical protein
MNALVLLSVLYSLATHSAFGAGAEGPVWVEGQVGNISGETVTVETPNGNFLMPRKAVESGAKDLKPGSTVRFQVRLEDVAKLNANR